MNLQCEDLLDCSAQPAQASPAITLAIRGPSHRQHSLSSVSINTMILPVAFSAHLLPTIMAEAKTWERNQSNQILSGNHMLQSYNLTTWRNIEIKLWPFQSPMICGDILDVWRLGTGSLTVFPVSTNFLEEKKDCTQAVGVSDRRWVQFNILSKSDDFIMTRN